MNIICNKSISFEKWKSFFKDSPFATPFQTPEYLDFFNSIFGISAEVFAVENDSNNLLALCVVTFQKEKGIKAYFSRRSVIYGGPLIEDSENGKLALNYLLSAISKELKRKAIYIETRNFKDYSSYKDSFLVNGWRFNPYLNFQIPLTGKSKEDIIGAMKYNRRREIQQSLKEGASAAEACNTDDVTAVYNILYEVYETRVKLPMPNLDFFIKLYNLPIGKVFVVKHNGQVIGGSFCIFYPNQSIYTMYYCGLRDYNSKIFPTHLAILATIEFGLRNNLQKVDLMGAGKPDQEYGVRKYKSEFGGDLVEHGRFQKIFNPFLYNVGSTALKLLKKT